MERKKRKRRKKKYLPSKILFLISTYLKISDLNNFLLTCKEFNVISNLDYFWKTRCKLLCNEYIHLKPDKPKFYEIINSKTLTNIEWYGVVETMVKRFNNPTYINLLKFYSMI